MRGELLLVLLERQDVTLSRVGGLGHLKDGRVVVRRLVRHLGRGEVEAAEPLGTNHDRVAVVAAGRDAVHGHLRRTKLTSITEELCLVCASVYVT